MIDDFEICTFNTISENSIEIFAEKKQMVKIGNIAISPVNDGLFEIYDFRKGLKVATLSVRKKFSNIDSLLEFFSNFELFTKDIVSTRDFLLKQFIGAKMAQLPCGACMTFQVEEFESFLLENQP